ncbi:MAG: hypothetical protein M0R80_26525 [Proteobacteria bacterium]|jgi:hypothetical protein|nr:hypothetical protein [Pseudomonadota bacterium]
MKASVGRRELRVFVEECLRGRRSRTRTLRVTASDVYRGRSAWAIAQAERLLFAAQYHAVCPSAETMVGGEHNAIGGVEEKATSKACSLTWPVEAPAEGR